MKINTLFFLMAVAIIPFTSCEKEVIRPEPDVNIMEVDDDANARKSCSVSNPGFSCNSSEGICGPVEVNKCDYYTYQLADYLKAYNCSNVSWDVFGGQVISSNNSSVTVQWTSGGYGGIEAFGCFPYVGIDLGVTVNKQRKPSFSYNTDASCITIKNNHCAAICLNVTLQLQSGATLTHTNVSIANCGSVQLCCGTDPIVGYSYSYC